MRSLSPAILALAVGLHDVMTGARQQAVFRSTTEVVAVDVAVTRSRSPVTGLTAADFVVFDNGVRQQIDSLSHGTLPLDGTLVLDLSGSTTSVLTDFLRATERVQRLLRPEDRWHWLGAFDEARELAPMQPVTQALPRLPRAIDVASTALQTIVRISGLSVAAVSRHQVRSRTQRHINA